MASTEVETSDSGAGSTLSEALASLTPKLGMVLRIKSRSVFLWHTGQRALSGLNLGMQIDAKARRRRLRNCGWHVRSCSPAPLRTEYGGRNNSPMGATRPPQIHRRSPAAFISRNLPCLWCIYPSHPTSPPTLLMQFQSQATVDIYHAALSLHPRPLRLRLPVSAFLASPVSHATGFHLDLDWHK